MAPGTSLDGNRYEIVSVVNTGSTCTIYRAAQVGLQRMVAIKMFSEPFARSPTGPAWIRCETVTGAAFTHSSLVQVLDRGEHEGTPYLVLELVDGESVAERITRFGCLPAPLIVTVVQDILSGLAHMHRRGIVHRDIKPQNILLTRAATGGGDVAQAKLCDFGIARLAGDQGMPGAGICGTPEYISPEQARGEVVDGRADIYGLGVTMFHMATGVLPFKATDPMMLLAKHASGHVPLPSSLCPDIDPYLEAVILQATALETAQRYQTVDEMRAAVDRLAEGGPAHAPSVVVDSAAFFSGAESIEGNGGGLHADPPLAPTEPSERPTVQVASRESAPRAAGWLAALALAVGLGIVHFNAHSPPSAAPHCAVRDWLAHGGELAGRLGPLVGGYRVAPTVGALGWARGDETAASEAVSRGLQADARHRTRRPGSGSQQTTVSRYPQPMPRGR